MLEPYGTGILWQFLGSGRLNGLISRQPQRMGNLFCFFLIGNDQIFFKRNSSHLDPPRLLLWSMRNRFFYHKAVRVGIEPTTSERQSDALPLRQRTTCPRLSEVSLRNRLKIQPILTGKLIV